VNPHSLFELKEVIGIGTCSKVFRAVRKFTRDVYAIKIVNLEASEDSIEEIQNDIHTLSLFQTPYVTKYYGSHLYGHQLWIVMEYLSGGSVLDIVCHKNPHRYFQIGFNLF
jgi:serine/threonine-protein kinase 24/25/MST4